MDFQSSSSSASPSETDGAATGRRKTRHPFYRGVRQKNPGNWVSELREPNKKSRIWLGTFPNPEMAAVAHDAAVLALYGAAARLNFPDSAYRLPKHASSSRQDIQRAALQAATDFTSRTSCTCVDSRNVDVCADASSPSSSKNGWSKINVETSRSCGGADWVDEEAMFNMPLLVDSMAEGMLLTPPAMKKGFNWSQEVDDDIDLTLWGD